ncbi:MAG TPA: hypothetical protein VHP99_06265, partial [Pyrinomonadaceae bacterium]|nr:hypothetical protein [Pyrinomonadaceae bacterium]
RYRRRWALQTGLGRFIRTSAARQKRQTRSGKSKQIKTPGPVINHLLYESSKVVGEQNYGPVNTITQTQRFRLALFDY